MSKLHHTKYKENYKKYILGTIETGIDDEPLKTNQEKIKYIFDRFYSEYGFMIERVGKQKAMEEWLRGLALNIEWYDIRIDNFGIKNNNLALLDLGGTIINS